MTQTGEIRSPVEGDWPAADLEQLGRCPVCGTAERAVALQGLRDKIFFCAPGSWTLWRCVGCSVVYLDPRPSVNSIGRAYAAYYTHVSKAEEGPKGPLKKFSHLIKHGIRDSYLNRLYGYHMRPALPMGWLLARLMPKKAQQARYRVRHLPAPSAGQIRLLDVGCGNGDFLQFARTRLGYNVEGLEIDPKARDVAAAQGITVHLGGLPGSGLPDGSYHQITMSHVLEHFHDPRRALQEVFQLLAPGGRVWILIPNAAATTIARFGVNSRLLEPPRHLVMFDARSVFALLEDVGFKAVAAAEAPNLHDHELIFFRSWMIEVGRDPSGTTFPSVPRSVRDEARITFADTGRFFKTGEMLCLVAYKLP